MSPQAPGLAPAWFRRPAKQGGSTLIKVAALAVIAGMLSAQPALAAITVFGFVRSFPTIQTVGKPVTAELWLVNHSDGPLTVTDLQFIPSCSNWDSDCTGGVADPGAFTVAATGSGQAQTACGATSFNLTVVNPQTGKVKVARSDGRPLILTQADIASDLDMCRISFGMTANRLPNHDANTGLGGIQTNQNMIMTGTVHGASSSAVQGDMTTVESPTVVRSKARSDFNGDRRSDIGVYRSSVGNWYIQGMPAVNWGADPSDIPVPADYDGDGDSDIAVYRRSTGTWWIRGMDPVGWGGDQSDIPVPGDYNKDGVDEVAVYRKATGIWWIKGMPAVNWGGDAADVPVPADYDGDGDTDIAVYRTSTGIWMTQGMPYVNWGGDPSDIPVAGNYDRDAASEIAIYRRSTGIWMVQGMPYVNWGGDPSDVAVPGDYDGNGVEEPAVYRVNTGIWWIQGMPAVNWGGEQSDNPIRRIIGLLDEFL